MPGVRGAVGAVAAGLAVVAALVVLGEAALRLAAIGPPEWPGGGEATMPGVRMDPLLGPTLDLGWSGRWLLFDVAADAHGFRSTGFPPPPAPRHRIAFLGDSCTFGWGVDTPDTFVARLDARQRAAGADMEL